jgi:hypothetical protein
MYLTEENETNRNDRIRRERETKDGRQEEWKKT